MSVEKARQLLTYASLYDFLATPERKRVKLRPVDQELERIAMPAIPEDTNLEENREAFCTYLLSLLDTIRKGLDTMIETGVEIRTSVDTMHDDIGRVSSETLERWKSADGDKKMKMVKNKFAKAMDDKDETWLDITKFTQHF
jgi:hypothetical protein